MFLPECLYAALLANMLTVDDLQAILLIIIIITSTQQQKYALVSAHFCFVPDNICMFIARLTAETIDVSGKKGRRNELMQTYSYMCASITPKKAMLEIHTCTELYVCMPAKCRQQHWVSDEKIPVL